MSDDSVEIDLTVKKPTRKILTPVLPYRRRVLFVIENTEPGMAEPDDLYAYVWDSPVEPGANLIDVMMEMDGAMAEAFGVDVTTEDLDLKKAAVELIKRDFEIQQLKDSINTIHAAGVTVTKTKKKRGMTDADHEWVLNRIDEATTLTDEDRDWVFKVMDERIATHIRTTHGLREGATPVIRPECIHGELMTERCAQCDAIGGLKAQGHAKTCIHGFAVRDCVACAHMATERPNKIKPNVVVPSYLSNQQVALVQEMNPHVTISKAGSRKSHPSRKG